MNIIRRKLSLLHLFGFIFLFLLAVIIIMPFLFLLVTSVKTMGQFYQTDFEQVWFPWPLHFENYLKALTQIELPLYMLNSLMLCSIQTALCVVSSSFVAYGFARFRFWGRDVLFILVLSVMMLPAQVTSIPLLLLYRSIRWTQTFLPLIIPYFFGSAWHIFLIRQFMLTIPTEMEEAAVIDGCNTFQIWYKVIIPQSVPALFVSGLFQFLYSWRDLLAPLMFIQNKKLYPLSVGLLYFESPTEPQATVQMAAAVIALVPTIIFFAIGRRYLEAGIQLELK